MTSTSHPRRSLLSGRLRFVAQAALLSISLYGQSPSSECRGGQGATEYVILITSDGLRWQEVFSGADPRLIDADAGGVKDPDALRRNFGQEDAKTRRERLLPFFWNVVAKQGQVFGAPEADSKAVVANGLNFSYPGYQELLCGFPDPAVDSNDKKNNANVSVLEWLNRQDAYRGKVAAFTSWEVFPYILNVERSDLPVNAGWRPLDDFHDEAALRSVNRLMNEVPRFAPAARIDAFTVLGAMQYLELRQPHVLYLSLDETDEWCHAGRYDLYLEAAHRVDRWLEELWDWISKSEKYAGKTSLVFTTDHGRGDGREDWKSHGKDLPGSNRIWIAVLGPDTEPLGLRQNIEVTQGQVAATVAALLGQDFAAADPRIRPPLPGAVRSESASP
jgi:hypothetical protein